MKEKKSQLLLGLVCIVLGLILSYQWKSTYENLYTKSNRDYSNLANQLDTLKKQRDERVAVLQGYKNKIDVYERKAVSSNKTTKALKDKIDELRLISGLVDVHGEGIIISITPITDMRSGEISPIAKEDIIEIINDLNSAGAEAISINDQRYTDMTRIEDVANGILINGVKFGLTQVFTIKAIGNPDELNNIIKLPDNSLDVLKDSGFDIKISSESKVRILKYSQFQ
jgi:uncharacterized protein YlxW (UPF0749 family)